MRKMFKSLMSGISAGVLLCSAFGVNCAADEYDLNLSIDYNTEETLPLTLAKDTDVFYFNANINPGDVFTASISVENESEESLQYTLSEIVNQLTDDEQAILLRDVINLQISIDGEVIYDAPCSDVTSPVTPWYTLESGETDVIEVEYTFDKTADNTYQAANMREKWIFQTRADVPEDDPDEGEPATIVNTPNTNSEASSAYENVQTGVKEESKNYTLIIGIIGVIVAVGYITVEIIMRKKRHNQN